MGEHDSIHHGRSWLSSTCLRIGFWCQQIWYGFILVQIDSVKQPIQRDFAGSGHVSHRRTSAFNDHFDYSIIAFRKMHSWASSWECFAFVTTWSTLDSSATSRLLCIFVLVLALVVMLWVSLHDRFPDAGTFLHEFNTSITKSQRSRAGIPSMRKKTGIQWNNFRFSWTVRHWSLFLTHPTCRNECSTSEDT